MKITILSEIRERFRKLLEDKPIEVEEYNIYLSWDLDNGTELDGKTIWSFFLPHLKDNTTEHDKKIAEEAVMGFVEGYKRYLKDKAGFVGKVCALLTSNGDSEKYWSLKEYLKTLNGSAETEGE